MAISTAYNVRNVRIGDSIACSGTCLTVVEKGTDWFAVDVSAETLRCTTLGSWKQGTKINLEQALKLGEALGGHLVSGHVDGTGILKTRSPEGESITMEFEVPAPLAPYMAAKGSVAVDGISLTINRVADFRIWVNIIPHTLEATTLGQLDVGGSVNLEIDLIARYVARLMGKS